MIIHSRLKLFLVVGILISSVIPIVAQKKQKASDYSNSALQKQENGDLDGALADYDRAIALDPRLDSAYNNRANINLQKGDLDGVISDYSKALELNPRSVETYFNRGDVQLQKGDYDAAISDFTSSLQLGPEFAMAYNNRGMRKSLRRTSKVRSVTTRKPFNSILS
ncbi:MAG TPA: tetratricopeptide repeat protein [Pyrinomonadaceae bacterium]|nr:tetratricopeptide repeat protein [Pyrinomonadaceae bacterium]